MSLDIPGWGPHLPRLEGLKDLQRAVHAEWPCLIYVYSPMCGYCQQGAPIFDTASLGLKHVYRYNARPHEDDSAIIKAAHDDFKTAVGVSITHYPMLLGVSKAGRIVEYNGPVTKKALKIFMKALDRT